MLRVALSIFTLAAALLQLALLPQVAAQTSVSNQKFEIDPRDLLLNKAGAKLTVSFIPTTRLPAGGFMYLRVGSFYAYDSSSFGGSGRYSPASLISCSIAQLSAAFKTSWTQSGAWNIQIDIQTSGADIPSGVCDVCDVCDLGDVCRHSFRTRIHNCNRQPHCGIPRGFTAVLYFNVRRHKQCLFAEHYCLWHLCHEVIFNHFVANHDEYCPC